ncbi:hypothetical protein D3C87_2176470 [compost metagenome]
MGAMAVVNRLDQHSEQAASVLKGKHQAAPSGIVGALAILSTFCLLTEEIVTPVTML